MRELRGLLQANPIFQDRTIDVGILSPEEALQWNVTGPSLRASGIAYDVRKAFPYTGYETYDFDVPTRTEGDAYARFLVRLDEMEQSMRIVQQARKRLDTPGPVMIDDPKVALPPKETIALSMEALIHHFKLISEGFRVPPGDVYQASSRRAANSATTSSATARTAHTASARVRRASTICKRSRASRPETSSPTSSS